MYSLQYVYQISYVSELPVKSMYKKAGVKVVKETESTVRFGIKYGNISSVKSRDDEPKKERTNNYVTVIPNKLVYNTNTEKYYVCAFPTRKGTHSKSIYKIFVNDVEIFTFNNCDLVKHLVIDSYWKKDFRETFRVSADNVIKLGKFVF